MCLRSRPVQAPYRDIQMVGNRKGYVYRYYEALSDRARVARGRQRQPY